MTEHPIAARHRLISWHPPERKTIDQTIDWRQIEFRTRYGLMAYNDATEQFELAIDYLSITREIVER